MKKCDKHNEEYILRGNRQRCRSCQIEYQKKHYLENQKQEIFKRRERADRVKKEHYSILIGIKTRPCADCGIVYPHYMMEFDHIRGKKVTNVSTMMGWSLEKLLAEVAKCEVVCSNCHKERTWQRNHASLV